MSGVGGLLWLIGVLVTDLPAIGEVKPPAWRLGGLKAVCCALSWELEGGVGGNPESCVVTFLRDARGDAFSELSCDAVSSSAKDGCLTGAAAGKIVPFCLLCGNVL